jgi:hypothetical protein
MADASANTKKLQAQTLYEFSKQRQYALNHSNLGLKGGVLMNGGGSSTEIVAEAITGATLTPYINPISKFVSVSAISIGINTFTIKWYGADNAEYYSYSIPVTIDNGLISQTATFSGLLPNKLYTIFVIASKLPSSTFEGGTQVSTRLDVLTGPIPPTNFILNSKGRDFISCSWTSPDPASVFTYSYTISGNDDSQESGITSTTNVTINNLNPGITYNISIFTVNIYGTTSAPAFLPSGNITTLPGILYSYITGLSPISFSVTWNSLAKTNSYYIDFPRIEAKSSINFTPSTSYAIGDIITYNNEKYICTTPYTPIIIGIFLTPYANPELDNTYYPGENYNRENFTSPMKTVYQYPKSYLDVNNPFSFNINVDSTGNNAIIFVTETTSLEIGNYITGPYINGYSQLTNKNVNIVYNQNGGPIFSAKANNIVISNILNFNQGFDTTGQQYTYTIYATNSPEPVFSLTNFTLINPAQENQILYSTVNIGLETSYSVSQISSCTLYDFKVYACNSVWDSTPSSIITSLLTPPTGPVNPPEILAQTFGGFINYWPLEGLITETYPSSLCLLYDTNSNILQSNYSIQSNYSNYFSTIIPFSGLNINQVNLSITTFNASGISSSTYIIPLLTTYSNISITTFNSNESPYIQISSILTAGNIYSNTFQLYSYGAFCNVDGFIQGTSYKLTSGTELIDTFSTLTPVSPPNKLSNGFIEYSTINITSNTIYKLESKLFYSPTAFFEIDYFILTIESGPDIFSNISINGVTSNSFNFSWNYKFSNITSYYTISNTSVLGQSYAFQATGQNLGNTVQSFTVTPNILEYQNSIGIYSNSIVSNIHEFISYILMAPSSAKSINYCNLAQTSVSLTWSNDSIGLFAALSTFVLYDALTCNLPDDSTSYSIAGLTTNTLYTFSIVACNTQGIDPPGSSVSPCAGGTSVGSITIRTAPPNVLSSILPSNITSTFFTFNFPSIANTFFAYSLSNQGEQSFFITTSNITGATSCNVTFLSPNTTYWYYITQYTAYWSNTISNTVTTTPSPVNITYITTISTIQISWPLAQNVSYYISTGTSGYSTIYVPNATSPFRLTGLSTANALSLSVGQSNAGGIQYTTPSTIWTNPLGPSNISWLAVSISSITLTWPQETTNNGVSYRCVLTSNYGPLIETANVTNSSRIYTNTISLLPVGFLAQCNFYNVFQLYISTITPTITITSQPFSIGTQPSYASITTYISSIPSNGFSIGACNIYSCGGTMICGMNYYSYGYATSFSNLNYQLNSVPNLGYISSPEFVGIGLDVESFATNDSYASPSNLLKNSIYRIDHLLKNYLTSVNLPALSTVIKTVYLLTPELNPFQNFVLSNITNSSLNIYNSWYGPTCNVSFSDSTASLFGFGSVNGSVVTTVLSSTNNTSNYVLTLNNTITLTGPYRGNNILFVSLKENTYAYQSTIGTDITLYPLSTYYLYILTAPDPSSNISYTNVLSNGFTLSFSNNSGVFGDQILTYYASNIGGNIYGSNVSTNLNVLLPVTGLNANTSYEMTILACNVKVTPIPGLNGNPCGGGITASSNVNILTAPAPASNITRLSNTQTSITLSWANASIGGSVPISTFITYNGLTCNASQNSTSYMIGSLTENTSYTFSIISCNIQTTSSPLGGGYTQSSNFTTYTPGAALTEITYIPSLFSISANWSTIAGATYIISTTTSGYTSIYTTNITPPYTINNLQTGNSISLSIGSSNSGGISYSAPSTLWTLPFGVIPPLVCNSVNISSFTVIWSPESANNGLTYRVNLYDNNNVFIENSPIISNSNTIYTPLANLFPASGYNTYSNIYNVYISTITPAGGVSMGFSPFKIYTQLKVISLVPYYVFTPPLLQISASNVTVAGLVTRIEIWMHDYGYSSGILNSSYQQQVIDNNPDPFYSPGSLYYNNTIVFNATIPNAFSQNYNKVIRLLFRFYNMNLRPTVIADKDTALYESYYLLTPQHNPFNNIVLSNITNSSLNIYNTWYGPTCNVSFSQSTASLFGFGSVNGSVVTTVLSSTNNTSNYSLNLNNAITLTGPYVGGNNILYIILKENTYAYQSTIGINTNQYLAQALCNIYVLTAPDASSNISYTNILSNGFTLTFLNYSGQYGSQILTYYASNIGGNILGSNISTNSNVIFPVTSLNTNTSYGMTILACNVQVTPVPGTYGTPCGGGISTSSNIYILTAPAPVTNIITLSNTQTSINLFWINASIGGGAVLISTYITHNSITCNDFQNYTVYNNPPYTTTYTIGSVVPDTVNSILINTCNVQATAPPGTINTPCGGGITAPYAIYILSPPYPRINVGFNYLTPTRIDVTYNSQTVGTKFITTDYGIGVVGLASNVTGGNVYGSMPFFKNSSSPLTNELLYMSLTGLLANTIYTFAIVSCNDTQPYGATWPGTLTNPFGGGASFFSSNLYILTAPNAATNLSFTATQTTITLSWTNQNTGSITNIVRITNPIVRSYFPPQTNVSSYTVTGLTSATNYIMSVRANNAKSTPSPGNLVDGACGGGSTDSSNITVRTL